jgi:hypothetical protein
LRVGVCAFMVVVGWMQVCGCACACVWLALRVSSWVLDEPS